MPKNADPETTAPKGGSAGALRDEAASVGDAAPPQPPGSAVGSAVQLRSLAPKYVSEQHASYVRHLNTAVSTPAVRNIALTGRYGSGKSSILDEFLRQQKQDHKKRTLRISINTLGPDEDEDITNRIQKELVKQLVYRAEPGKVRRSRFVRGKDLTWWRCLRDASGVASVLLVLLRLFGVWPGPQSLGRGPGAYAVGTAFVLSVLAACWIVRRLVGNRLVTTFSTGSASVTLEDKPDSYFDEYLDEIVAFFDATQPDIVVFEDLDRFDDARIFDSLRELNTLINASSHWAGKNKKLLRKAEEQRPLRFVYAIKDSLFEQLGDSVSTKDEEGEANRRDAADEVVKRANRTKFFEIVIPIVPFLSHSNARDLFVEAVRALELPEGTTIDRRLLDTVARHTTDMRLLLNICNEFVVFAERLLWVQRPAPGITADNLFALVAYKNFHLADFEALPQRGSALDRLQAKRQKLIRSAIVQLQQTRRELHRANDLQREQRRAAKRLGERLLALRVISSGTFLHFEIDGVQFQEGDACTAAFWTRVIDADRLAMVFQVHVGYNMTIAPIVLDHDRLSVLFPEAMDPVQWQEPDDKRMPAGQARIDRQVAQLRGAGFADLAGKTPVTDGGEAFDDDIETILDSQLARDLVRRGFVDRYYAEYAAAFYGAFLGVDVANFFRNSVWPNEMDVNFEFTTENAVQNVLAQAPEGFTSSRSAFNVEIVNHLLKHNLDEAKEVVAFIVAQPNDDARAFLAAFLNALDSHKEGLVSQLAKHPWAETFNHLAADASVPDEATRTRLLDAALSSAAEPKAYELGAGARTLIAERHQDLACFTRSQSAQRTGILVAFVRAVGLEIPELLPLAGPLRSGIVAAGGYALTANNLRVALGLRGDVQIGLEEMRRSDDVWSRCRDGVDTYFQVLDHDDATPYAVRTPDALRDVVVEEHEEWTKDQLEKLLALGAPQSALPDITAVPAATWPMVVFARLMLPNVANIRAYADQHGIDKPLARLLADERGKPVPMPGIDAVNDTERAEIAVLILNSRNHFASVALAVGLVRQLSLQVTVDPGDLNPSQDDLLARLLEAGLLPDAIETFEHFLTAGWPAVAEAFAVSKSVADFLTPQLVSGVVENLLCDSRVPDSVKKKVIEGLGSYVVDDDQGTLRAAAEHAHARRLPLPAEEVRRIAPAMEGNPEPVLWQLTKNADLTAQQLIEIVPLLGGDWAGLAEGHGHEFEVPVTDSTKSVLERLRAGGHVDLPGRETRGRKKVRNIV